MDPVAYDMELRAHMIGVYGHIAGGVILAGITTWLTYQVTLVSDATGEVIGVTPFGEALFGGPLSWLIPLTTLGLMLFLGLRVAYLQPSTAKLLFFGCTGLFGASLATIFPLYVPSIARTLFVSAAAFGVLSLCAIISRRSFRAVISFLIMCLFGFIMGGIVNVFLVSSGLDWTLSAITILIFAILAAILRVEAPWPGVSKASLPTRSPR